MTAPTTPIGRLQATTALLVLGLLGLQIPIISIAQALFLDAFSWREPVFCIACLAVGAAAKQAASPATARFVLSVLLAASGLASISVFAGHEFQPGMQVYAYVLVAVVVGFCEWRANAFAAATVAAGTALLAAFSPAAAGWRSGHLLELGLYLWLAVFAGVLLAWLAHALADAFARADSAVAKAEEAHAQVVAATSAAAAADAKAHDERRQMLDGIARSLDAEIAALAKDVAGEAGTAKADAGTLHGSVGVGVAQVDTLSTESARARGAAESVAQATQQLSGSIEEITRLVARSAEMSRTATEKARATAGIIEGLSEAASSIEAVVASIAGIAGTTNLLALNATIEAARAGEAGKGFAVVAGEVKGLAGQTAKATAEAGERIAALRESTQHAADALRAIAQTIYEIDASAATITAAVATQDSATKEIARSAADAAAGAEAASAATDAVGAAWADVRTRADSIGELSDRLVDQTGRLTQAIRGFVGRLTAA